MGLTVYDGPGAPLLPVAARQANNMRQQAEVWRHSKPLLTWCFFFYKLELYMTVLFCVNFALVNIRLWDGFVYSCNLAMGAEDASQFAMHMLHNCQAKVFRHSNYIAIEYHVHTSICAHGQRYTCVLKIITGSRSNCSRSICNIDVRIHIYAC